MITHVYFVRGLTLGIHRVLHSTGVHQIKKYQTSKNTLLCMEYGLKLYF